MISVDGMWSVSLNTSTSFSLGLKDALAWSYKCWFSFLEFRGRSGAQ